MEPKVSFRRPLATIEGRLDGETSENRLTVLRKGSDTVGELVSALRMRPVEVMSLDKYSLFSYAIHSGQSVQACLKTSQRGFANSIGSLLQHGQNDSRLFYRQIAL